jgi:hypothetical protein
MSWENTNIEVQCKASCSYCKKTVVFWAGTSFADTEHGAKSNLVIEAMTPEGWYRGRRYMTDTPDMRCEECSQKPQY